MYSRLKIPIHNVVNDFRVAYLELCHCTVVYQKRIKTMFITTIVELSSYIDKFTASIELFTLFLIKLTTNYFERYKLIWTVPDNVFAIIAVVILIHIKIILQNNFREPSNNTMRRGRGGSWGKKAN